MGRRDRELIRAGRAKGQIVALSGEDECSRVGATQLIPGPLPVANFFTGGSESKSGFVESDLNLDLAVTEIDNPMMFGQLAPQQ